MKGGVTQEVINLRCPHSLTKLMIYEQIKMLKNEGDSLGGVIQGCIYNLPKGLGEPVFDKVFSILNLRFKPT